jgi:phosphatidylserine decarboxylase
VWADLGDRVQTGDETGLMPLGGLVETYVPVGASIRVRAGQAVRAGETVLAILPAPATP